MPLYILFLLGASLISTVEPPALDFPQVEQAYEQDCSEQGACLDDSVAPYSCYAMESETLEVPCVSLNGMIYGVDCSEDGTYWCLSGIPLTGIHFFSMDDSMHYIIRDKVKKIGSKGILKFNGRTLFYEIDRDHPNIYFSYQFFDL